MVALLLSIMGKNIYSKLYTCGVFVFVFIMLAGFQVQAKSHGIVREHVRDMQKPAYPHPLTTQLTAQLVPFRPYIKGSVYNTVGVLNMSLSETYLEHQKMRNDASAFLNTLKSHWRRLFRDVARREFRDFFTNTLLGVSTRGVYSSASGLKSAVLAQPLLFQLNPKLNIDLDDGNFEVGFEKKLEQGFVGEASFDTEHSSLKGSLKKQISNDFYFHLKTTAEFSDKKEKNFGLGFNFNF